MGGGGDVLSVIFRVYLQKEKNMKVFECLESVSRLTNLQNAN